jgi:hypothetical protein
LRLIPAFDFSRRLCDAQRRQTGLVYSCGISASAASLPPQTPTTKTPKIPHDKHENSQSDLDPDHEE